MDRTELLKLALQHSKDPREALDLAREMAAFVAGEAAPQPQPLPHPPQPAPQPPAAAREARAPSVPAPAALSRRKKRWAPEEKERAAVLLDNGLSRLEVAHALKRTVEALSSALRDGQIPCKVYRKDPDRVLGGAMAALSRGHALRQPTHDAVAAGAGGDPSAAL